MTSLLEGRDLQFDAISWKFESNSSVGKTPRGETKKVLAIPSLTLWLQYWLASLAWVIPLRLTVVSSEFLFSLSFIYPNHSSVQLMHKSIIVTVERQNTVSRPLQWSSKSPLEELWHSAPIHHCLVIFCCQELYISSARPLIIFF